MRTESTGEQMAAWGAFLRAHAGLTEVLAEELEAEAGLPLAWFDVLYQLSVATEGRMPMQELARAVLLSKSGLSRLFTRMAAAGLVARRPCPGNLRVTFATLTPAGVAALRRAQPVHLCGIQEHFARHLTADETTALQGAFEKLVRALPAQCRGASGPEEQRGACSGTE